MSSIKTIEETYDALASLWAEKFFNEHEVKQKDQEMLRWFSDAVRPGGEVLDMACGPGNTARWLFDLGVAIRGVDISLNFILEARRRNPRIRFEKGDILSLEEADASLAGVVCFYGIVHFGSEQIQQAFDEVFRVLENHGLFLFTYHVGDDCIHQTEFLGETIDVDFILHPTAAIVHHLQQSGFVQIAVVERDPYPHIEYQSRRAYGIARKAV